MSDAARRRTIRRRSIPKDFEQYLNDYLLNRSMREKSSLIENERKGVLMDVLAEVGISQEGGHKVIVLDQPLEYHHYVRPDRPTVKKVTAIERQRRVRQSLNEDRTLALLEAKGLTAQCTSTIVVIEESEVLAANYSGQISDAELKALWDESETFAFLLTSDD